MRTRSVSVATLAAVVLSLPLTACTGDDGATPPETVTVTVSVGVAAPSPVQAASGDARATAARRVIGVDLVRMVASTGS